MSDAIEKWLDTLPQAARDTAEARLQRLAVLLHERRVQFLIGAGMSFSSGFPLGRKLSEIMLSDLIHGGSLSSTSPVASRLVDMFPLDAVAEAYLRQFDEASLTRLIKKIYGSSSAGLHDGHRKLRYFADHGFVDRIYTTNFDRLIEDSLMPRSVSVTDENIEDVHTAKAENKTVVYHLHGAVGAGPRITEHDTFELNTAVAELFIADLMLYWFVCVGYSMADMDLRYLFLSAHQLLTRQHAAKRPFIINPLIAATDADWRVADMIWSARNFMYIPGTAELALPALESLLGRIGGDAIARAIVTKMGGNPDEPDEIRGVWNRAIAMQSSNLGSDRDALDVLAEQYGITDENNS